jgi:hypothetical protein
LWAWLGRRRSVARVEGLLGGREGEGSPGVALGVVPGVALGVVGTLLGERERREEESSLAVVRMVLRGQGIRQLVRAS